MQFPHMGLNAARYIWICSVLTCAYSWHALFGWLGRIHCSFESLFRNRVACSLRSHFGWLSLWRHGSVLLRRLPRRVRQRRMKPSPIAIVPLDSKNPDKAAKVTGALEVTQGKAIIASSGTITSGTETTQVILPHRGVLRVCASTSVKLAADTSVPAGEIPGLMIAMDHGAVEASYATGQNSDILLTPDFRILIGGPGAADVKIRLGQHGDTCVDNAGINAPYVLVSSVFEGGAYRVQPGQRVMFEHGSLHEVVDQEKEPCGCPPAAAEGTNEFPLAQSEGLAPLAKPAPSAVNAGRNAGSAG